MIENLQLAGFVDISHPSVVNTNVKHSRKMLLNYTIGEFQQNADQTSNKKRISPLCTHSVIGVCTTGSC